MLRQEGLIRPWLRDDECNGAASRRNETAIAAKVLAAMARRLLTGILLLDKPTGLSSHAALQQAKTLIGADKAGHTGSLDPLATGSLPICFGEATKIAGVLLGARKAYEAVFALGKCTDSDDADGTVLSQRPVPPLKRSMIDSVLASFSGTLLQRAPVYSALKHHGEPLYRRARRGENPTPPIRTVHIEAMELVDWTPSALHVRVVCSAGTYIRSLARDIGEAIGCGAHVSRLRRLWVAPFDSAHLVTFSQLQGAVNDGYADQLLLPLAAGLSHIPSIFLDDERLLRFRHGQRLHDLRFPSGHVAVYRAVDQCPAGLGYVGPDEVLESKRRFNV